MTSEAANYRQSVNSFFWKKPQNPQEKTTLDSLFVKSFSTRVLQSTFTTASLAYGTKIKKEVTSQNKRAMSEYFIINNKSSFFIFRMNSIDCFRVSLWSLNIYLSNGEIEQSSEAVVQRCSVKKVFLEISQNSQENNCIIDYFLQNNSSGYFWKLVMPYVC